MKHTLMREYYANKCIELKENSKILWSLINNTISKVKHNGSIITSITGRQSKTIQTQGHCQQLW